MKYQEARQYLRETQKYGIVPGLLNMIALCEALGNIQNKIKTVQIAGTNGKGSVGAFLERILREAGWQVGRYCSPAVLDPRECYQVQGEWISEDEYAECAETVMKAAEHTAKSGPHPTAFEIETAMAFVYFYQKKCDIVLLEAGMGGAKDATNVAENTILSVITSISMDHCKFLGGTLEEIALEKAGIIKEKSCVVSAQQEKAVSEILKRTAAAHDADFYECVPVRRIQGGLKQLSFDYREFENLELGTGGDFQADNAALAVEAARKLDELGFHSTEGQIRSGLKAAFWPGRFQVAGEKPVFIIDGAHNPDGIGRLCESIDHYLKEKNIAAVTGVFKDKEFDAMAEKIAPKCRMIFTVTPPGPRGLKAEQWTQILKKYNQQVYVKPDVQAAVSSAVKSGCDVVLCFGTLSYLSEVLKLIPGQ